MTILYFDGYGPRSYYDMLTEAMPAEFTLRTLETRDPAERIERAKDCDVLIAASISLPEAVLHSASKLKLVHHFGVGYQDTLSIESLRRRGLRLALTPAGTTETVAEHAIMLMLSTQRRLVAIDADTRQGNFRSTEFAAECMALFGRTVGIVGMGRIGRAVAQRLRAFGVAIVYYDPYATLEASTLGAGTLEMSETENTRRAATLDELLRLSDVVTLHVPLTDETRGFIDAAALAKMKPTAILVNTARGAVVDETALVEALASKQILAAGLDVFSPEPPHPDNPLFGLSNVVLTPHSTGKNRGAVQAKMGFVCANIERFIVGKKLENEIVLS